MKNKDKYHIALIEALQNNVQAIETIKNRMDRPNCQLTDVYGSICTIMYQSKKVLTLLGENDEKTV